MRGGRAELGAMLAGVARGLLDAQSALDRRADASLERWSEEGIPPSGINLMEVRVNAQVDCVCSTGLTPFQRTNRAMLNVAPRRAAPAKLTVTLRYLPWPSNETGDR